MVAGLALPLPAAAQGISLAREVTPAGDRGFAVQDSEVSGAARLHAAALLETAVEPLVVITPSQQRDRVVARDTWVHAGLALAVRHRLLLGLELPVLVERTSDVPAGDSTLERPSTGPELGDVRGLARVRVLGPADDGLRVAVAGSLWAPTGARDSYASDERLRGGASAILGGSGERWDFAVEAGWRSRRDTTIEGVVPLRVGAQVLAGVAVRYAVDARQHVTTGAELQAEGTVTNGARLLDPRSTRGLALAAVRWRVGGSPLVAAAAAGPGLGAAPGAGELRAGVRVGWSPLVDPPPPDRDHDEVPDADDACARLFGYPSPDPNMNGCPEPPSDFDFDSIPDEFDACPRRNGVPTGVRATHGCPRPKDRDQDQILDGVDACPAEPGVASEDAARNGCPAPPPPPPPPPAAELVASQIVISQEVQFDVGTARLRPESDAVLAEVARVLAEHAELTRVEVQGHTDDTGSPAVNRALAAERAAAVVAWLVAHGVETSRLVPQGYGADRPRADNATEAGRERNRRVEFHVLESAEGEP